MLSCCLLPICCISKLSFAKATFRYVFFGNMSIFKIMTHWPSLNRNFDSSAQEKQQRFNIWTISIWLHAGFSLLLYSSLTKHLYRLTKHWVQCFAQIAKSAYTSFVSYHWASNCVQKKKSQLHSFKEYFCIEFFKCPSKLKVKCLEDKYLSCE